MNEYLSEEELEDLEGEFSERYSDFLDEFENSLIDFYKKNQYQSFIDLMKKVKEFCYAGGVGGVEYFKNMWENDPRLSASVKSLSLQNDYPDGVTGKDILKEITIYIQGKENVLAKEIYQQFQQFQHEQIRKCLSILCKEKIIRKDYDSFGRVIYILS